MRHQIVVGACTAETVANTWKAVPFQLLMSSWTSMLRTVDFHAFQVQFVPPCQLRISWQGVLTNGVPLARPGSHHPSFRLPVHNGWRQQYSTADQRGPQWPAHAELRAVAPMQAGDALVCERARALYLSLCARARLYLLKSWSLCCIDTVTEHLTHGTLPWLANKERRTVFLKYTQHGTVRPHTPGTNNIFAMTPADYTLQIMFVKS